jgi:hypothetical protein
MLRSLVSKTVELFTTSDSQPTYADVDAADGFAWLATTNPHTTLVDTDYYYVANAAGDRISHFFEGEHTAAAFTDPTDGEFYASVPQDELDSVPVADDHDHLLSATDPSAFATDGGNEDALTVEDTSDDTTTGLLDRALSLYDTAASAVNRVAAGFSQRVVFPTMVRAGQAFNAISTLGSGGTLSRTRSLVSTGLMMVGGHLAGLSVFYPQIGVLKAAEAVVDWAGAAGHTRLATVALDVEHAAAYGMTAGALGTVLNAVLTLLVTYAALYTTFTVLSVVADALDALFDAAARAA